jgi:preprotein translocase subunit SecE
VKESVGELRKVVYPTGQQLLNYFVVVLVFVLFVIAYVSLLDLGLGWALFRVFS